MWKPELLIQLSVNTSQHAQFQGFTLCKAGESATVPMYGYGWNLKVYCFTGLVQYDIADLSGEHCY